MKGFAVHPKLDCPHLSQTQINELSQFLLNSNSSHFSEFACGSCGDKSENWICLECRYIGCSRYVKGHMAEHHTATQHQITLSFSDSSFWCYSCDSYIDHPTLIKARREFSKSKFAMEIDLQKKEDKKQKKQNENEKDKELTKKEQERNDEEEELMLQKELEKMEIEEKLKNEAEEKLEKHMITYEKLINGIKGKEFKKIVFLTGAGLSVAAGIPDFRTPGTGLYSQLAKMNLPRPQSVFELSYFASNPVPFLKLSKEWGTSDFKPTQGHKFIKKMQSEGLLFSCMTQNIDDLQTKAGVSEDKLIQAHGHSRTVHCIKCKKEGDVEAWRKLCYEKEECLRCDAEGCNGLVKPDVVFFGEQLPPNFIKAPQLMKEADLVFIIGTSLVVFPFAFLALQIEQNVPVVLINNTDSLAAKKNKLWMQGDIQENILKISQDLGWAL